MGTFIVGFPYETGRHIHNTIDLASGLGLDLAMFCCATPFPGTDMFDICLNEGIDTTLKTHIRGFDTLCLKADEVDHYREAATVQFMKSLMRRPWKPLQKIKSFNDLLYTGRVVKQGLRMVIGPSEGDRLDKYPNYRR